MGEFVTYDIEKKQSNEGKDPLLAQKYAHFVEEEEDSKHFDL